MTDDVLSRLRLLQARGREGSNDQQLPDASEECTRPRYRAEAADGSHQDTAIAPQHMTAVPANIQARLQQLNSRYNKQVGAATAAGDDEVVNQQARNQQQSPNLPADVSTRLQQLHERSQSNDGASTTKAVDVPQLQPHQQLLSQQQQQEEVAGKSASRVAADTINSNDPDAYVHELMRIMGLHMPTATAAIAHSHDHDNGIQPAVQTSAVHNGGSTSSIADNPATYVAQLAQILAEERRAAAASTTTTNTQVDQDRGGEQHRLGDSDTVSHELPAQHGMTNEPAASISFAHLRSTPDSSDINASSMHASAACGSADCNRKDVPSNGQAPDDNAEAVVARLLTAASRCLTQGQHEECRQQAAAVKQLDPHSKVRGNSHEQLVVIGQGWLAALVACLCTCWHLLHQQIQYCVV